MLKDLKRIVCIANRELYEKGLVRFTWGSVSALEPSMGLFVIKPSDVPFEELQPEQMVVMSMDGQKMEGRYQPSRDAETHRAIYMAWPMTVSAVAHVPSAYATCFAQAGLPIPAISAIHAEYFCGTVPVTRHITKEEAEGDYEYKMGELMAQTAVDPERVPGVLLRNHSPYVWGDSPKQAVRLALALEALAYTTYITRGLNPDTEGLPDYLLDQRYARRNG